MHRFASEELYGHPIYEQVDVLRRGDEWGFRHHVVLARNKMTGNLVALKLLKRAQAGTAAREVLHHMSIQHPHVIALQEVFLTSEYIVLVLEHAEEGNLAEHMKNSKGLPESEARWLFQQVAFALDYCHRMGIASRNVKLDNLLVMAGEPGTRRVIKLCDFGLSAECRRDGPHGCAVRPSLHLGPESLEQGKGGPPCDAKKMDVWACGVLLHVLLTGSYPFLQLQDAKFNRKDRHELVLQRMQNRDYNLPPWVSEECKDLVHSMLTPDPKQRPTIREVLQHPWCCEGMDAASVLQCNDSLITRSLDNPLPQELIYEVRELLKEAASGGGKPRGAQAHSSGSGDGGDTLNLERAGSNSLLDRFKKALAWRN